MQIKRFLPELLATRLVLLMTLALLPLGMISIWQTNAVIKESEALSRTALMAQTRDQASAERRLVQQTLGAGHAMASVALSLNDERCSLAMQQLVADNPEYIFAGFVPLDGQMSCSSTDEVIDLTEIPGFATDVQRDTPFVQVNPRGAVTNQPVLIVSQPVKDDTGVRGQITISIPHAIAIETRENADLARGLKLASFNSDGEIIAATGGLDAAAGYLPRDTALVKVSDEDPTTFRALSNDGRERFFAVAPLVPGTLNLIGSWPSDTAVGSTTTIGETLPALFPVLMWFACMGVAVLGLQHLVLRHVGDLRSAMRQFALGERGSEVLKLNNPPKEFDGAQRAFNRMALILTEAESRREQDLRDKEVLLKEVHHRVKNNLQLIASIMNMQMRRARTDEAKYLLAGLQQRVRGLAMLHRTLYTTTEVTTIDSRELIKTVVADASSLLPDHQTQVETDLVSFPLYPDQAVPVSMIVAETLTNAFKYTEAGAGAAPVRVHLELVSDTVARLTITNPVSDARSFADPEASDGLGSQLLKAFIRQLDGVSHTAVADGVFTFEITFERRDFESSPNAG